MKFLTLILLLFSSVAFGATAQVNAVCQWGGKTDSAGAPGLIYPAGAIPVVFIAAKSSTTANARESFIRESGTINVKASVTAAKTLVICGWWNSGSDASANMAFGYSTATFTDDTAGAAPGGTVDIYYGNTNTAVGGGLSLTFQAANTYTWFTDAKTFPAGAFPFFLTDTTARHSVTMVGYEL